MAHPEALGWMARMLTVLTKAMKATFDGSYPIEDFRDVHVGTDFPKTEVEYPGIWIDFDPTGELQTAGIGHRETVYDEEDEPHAVKRWRFAGYATFTISALTNFERARLLDEVIKVMAFGDMDAARNAFRDVIHENDYLGLNFDFDQIGVVGKSEIQGTPWGSDDVIYEVTARMECVGEFLSDVSTGILVPISAIHVYPYVEGTTDPSTEPPLSDDPADWR